MPPYGRAGLYKQLAELKSLVAEYREGGDGVAAFRVPIVEQLRSSGLQSDCPYICATSAQPIELTSENVEAVEDGAFDAYVSKLYFYLQEVEGRLFSEGLHILGNAPTPKQAAQYLSAYFGDNLPQEAVDVVAATSVTAAAEHSSLSGLAAARAALERVYSDSSIHVEDGTLQEALRIRSLLDLNTDELSGVIRALNGEYILPEAGGDLLRDGAGVLPTGRNIHALVSS